MNIQHLDYTSKLDALLALTAESEVVEFKEAKNSYDFSHLGKYFSALSNEANLNHHSVAWLVLGVNNQRLVVGSNYCREQHYLDRLKKGIADKTTSRITFINIHEVQHHDGRVLLFEIPAAPKGVPIAFEGHYYGREGESLSPLNLEEIERIRAQATLEDWSAAIVPDAGLDDLDDEALRVARNNFKSKFPDKADDVDEWRNPEVVSTAECAIFSVARL